MKDITIIILGEKENDYGVIPSNIELIRVNQSTFYDTVKEVKTKYIGFIKSDDVISDNYFNVISSKVKLDFDGCFVNYTLDCVDKNVKIMKNDKELLSKRPFYGDYIWSYLYRTDIFNKLIEIKDIKEFNKRVEFDFFKLCVIGEVIYTHKINGISILNDFCYKDMRNSMKFKNAIYMGNGCNGIFNGYISWIKNIGRCFANDFDITIIYDSMPIETFNNFSKYFKCVKYDSKVDYYCDRLLLTYSNYYYPKNIFTLEENYLFIHGNMSDFPNARRFYDDVYTKYIAVSKIAAQKAVGYFPTDKIDYILNPFKLDNELLKPHLKLVSAQRSTPVKRPERIEILANVLDELRIPYTWNVFMDKNENTNKNGIIYRKRVTNPFPYIEDADYFVLLSDSESMGYSTLEALALKTKVIVTPLEAFYEIGVVDGENGFVIPFEYFEEKNKDKLVELVKKIYREKDKEFDYRFDLSLCDGYKEVFKR